MRIGEDISDAHQVARGCVLTIGNFDGVHLGHQKILAAARKAAAKRKTELVAMTFDPHPVAVLQPEKSPSALTPLKLKAHLLSEFGVDCLLVLKSTVELLRLSAEDFVDRFLVNVVQPAAVIEGEDFNFGYQRTGNIDKLHHLGADKGFEVCLIGAKKIKLSTGENVRVSSTMIRNLLEAGNVADAALALGRPYRLIGAVVPGRGKGKQIGFPTANLQPAWQLIPAEGVYAGLVQSGRAEQDVCRTHERIPAALSIGRTQTLAPDHPQLIEAHLLIENVPDLIGVCLAMDFIGHLRPQMKFDSESELADQIARDCTNAKKILGAA